MDSLSATTDAGAVLSLADDMLYEVVDDQIVELADLRTCKIEIRRTAHLASLRKIALYLLKIRFALLRTVASEA